MNSIRYAAYRTAMKLRAIQKITRRKQHVTFFITHHHSHIEKQKRKESS